MGVYILQKNTSHLEEELDRMCGKVSEMVENCDKNLERLYKMVDEDVLPNIKV